MRRWTLGLALFACVTCALGGEASAVEKKPAPRVKRGSYSEYIIIRQKDRPPRVRQVYSGYSSNMPTPAFLYYGYPHSGDDTGIGPLDRR